MMMKGFFFIIFREYCNRFGDSKTNDDVVSVEIAFFSWLPISVALKNSWVSVSE